MGLSGFSRLLVGSNSREMISTFVHYFYAGDVVCPFSDIMPKDRKIR